MAYKFAGDDNDPLWKELGDLAIKKAVTTFVGEGIKAVVDIWKTRHIKEIDAEFKERARARKAEAADSTDKSDK